MRSINIERRIYPTFDAFDAFDPRTLGRVIRAAAKAGARIAIFTDDDGPEYLRVAFDNEACQLKFYQLLDATPA